MARRCTKAVQWKEVSKDVLLFQPSDHPQQVNFIWKPTNFNYKLYSLIDKVHASSDEASGALEKQLVVNHLENLRGICTKTGLVRTLKQFYQDRPDAGKITSFKSYHV
jgi:hypothetical protein